MRRAFNGNFKVNNPFGAYDPVAYANYGGRHPGTDYPLPNRTPLYAGMSGVVSRKIWGNRLRKGNELIITNGNTQRRYGHMDEITIPDGTQVKEGDFVGYSGYTGYVMDGAGKLYTPGGAHLHDELLINGEYVDLEKNLKGEDMPYTDAQYQALKADRDKYAEQASRDAYILAGRDPSKISRDEQRLRLGLTWEEFRRDIDRDMPAVKSPYELLQQNQSEGKLPPGTYLKVNQDDLKVVK